MDNAQKIFEQLVADRKSEVDRLIAELRPECLFMDFKCKNGNDGVGLLHEDDRRNFAKALSGFANSSGGVLIWGVDKQDGKKGHYKLIANPQNFLENLNRAEKDLVVPYVDGVVHELLFQEILGGVVATYVPRSEKTPHMAMMSKNEDKHYYKRAGDSFSIMPHFEIEDMFGRRSRPKLALNLYATLAAQSVPKKTYLLNVQIMNEGRAISKHYGFDLEFPKSLFLDAVRHSQRPGFVSPSKIDGRKVVLKYRNDHDQDVSPIYPGETLTLSPNNYKLDHLSFEVDIDDRFSWKNVVLNYKLYSENMSSSEGSVVFGELFSD